MILFRADGNAEIGSGHIMRCLSIADALRDRGAECLFVTAGAELDEIIRHAGFETRVLHTEYRHMEDEFPVLLPLLREIMPEIMIVDSYFVTEGYFRALPDAIRTAYVDDLTAAPYPVDVLVNYNLFAKEERYCALYAHVGASCPELLIGTKYAPLRKEFRGHPMRVQQEHISNVFVSTGGADHEHVALRYLRHLTRQDDMRKYRFHFVLGAMNGDAQEICRLAALQENIEIHQNVARMYELMIHCDAAITASGSTLYELCASEVPIISYVLANNQLELALGFCNCGASLYAGDVRVETDFPETFDEFIKRLDADCGKRGAMLRVAHGLVDGGGADRIAAALTGLENE